MKDETQKILGEFAFDSLSKHEGVSWEAFVAFFEKSYETYSDGYSISLKYAFKKHLTPEAKKWFCEIFSEEEKPEQPKEVFYHIGQTFKFEDNEKPDEILMLSTHKGQLVPNGIDHSRKDVSLIAINGKNKGRCFCNNILSYAEPITAHVENFDKITQEEFEEICGGSADRFTLIDDE